MPKFSKHPKQNDGGFSNYRHGIRSQNSRFPQRRMERSPGLSRRELQSNPDMRPDVNAPVDSSHRVENVPRDFMQQGLIRAVANVITQSEVYAAPSTSHGNMLNELKSLATEIRMQERTESDAPSTRDYGDKILDDVDVQREDTSKFKHDSSAHRKHQRKDDWSPNDRRDDSSEARNVFTKGGNAGFSEKSNHDSYHEHSHRGRQSQRGNDSNGRMERGNNGPMHSGNMGNIGQRVAQFRENDDKEGRVSQSRWTRNLKDEYHDDDENYRESETRSTVAPHSRLSVEKKKDTSDVTDGDTLESMKGMLFKIRQEIESLDYAKDCEQTSPLFLNEHIPSSYVAEKLTASDTSPYLKEKNTSSDASPYVEEKLTGDSNLEENMANSSKMTRESNFKNGNEEQFQSKYSASRYAGNTDGKSTYQRNSEKNSFFNRSKYNQYSKGNLKRPVSNVKTKPTVQRHAFQDEQMIKGNKSGNLNKCDITKKDRECEKKAREFGQLCQLENEVKNIKKELLSLTSPAPGSVHSQKQTKVTNSTDRDERGVKVNLQMSDVSRASAEAPSRDMGMTYPFNAQDLEGISQEDLNSKLLNYALQRQTDCVHPQKVEVELSRGRRADILQSSPVVQSDDSYRVRLSQGKIGGSGDVSRVESDRGSLPLSKHRASIKSGDGNDASLSLKNLNAVASFIRQNWNLLNANEKKMVEESLKDIHPEFMETSAFNHSENTQSLLNDRSHEDETQCQRCKHSGHLIQNCPYNKPAQYQPHRDRLSDNVTCSRCNKRGHLTRHCPAAEPANNTCGNCDSTTHYTRNCPNGLKSRGFSDNLPQKNSMKKKDLYKKSGKFRSPAVPNDQETDYVCQLCDTIGHSAKRCPKMNNPKSHVSKKSTDGRQTQSFASKSPRIETQGSLPRPSSDVQSMAANSPDAASRDLLRSIGANILAQMNAESRDYLTAAFGKILSSSNTDGNLLARTSQKEQSGSFGLSRSPRVSQPPSRSEQRASSLTSACYRCGQTKTDQRHMCLARPPPSYRCVKCQQPGHFIENCPNVHSTVLARNVCLRCEKPGHLTKDCPTSNPSIQSVKTSQQVEPETCTLCGQFGHIWAVCPKRFTNPAYGDVAQKSIPVLPDQRVYVNPRFMRPRSAVMTQPRGLFTPRPSQPLAYIPSVICHKCNAVGHLAQYCPH